MKLDGERAVVTGGGRAIGLCCAEAFVEAGAAVVVIERSEADAVQALALRDRGHDVVVKTGDVTDLRRMAAIADELAAEGRPATILVNNAGIGLPGAVSETMTTRSGCASWTSTSTASSGARAASAGT